MEYYKNQLCVTFDELVPEVIIKKTLDSCIHRHNIQCLRRGGYGHPALYSFQSLPTRYKMKFEDIYGDPTEAMKQQQLKDELVMDEAARSYYEAFEYNLNGVQSHLSDKLIEEYTMNASVLNLLIRRMNDLRTDSHALGAGRRSDLWDIIFKQSEKMREPTGHTLPGNPARLKEKMKRYKKEKYEVLINGRLGNRNTLKITPTAARRLIALKRSRVPVYTDSQIFEAFNADAEKRGLKPLKSIRSMKAWLGSAAVEPLWHDAVYGEMSAHQKFDRKHRTELPQMRDALWYGDGTKINLFYRDDDGKVRTTSVYEVIDAYSETFLGFHISDNEDYEAQYMSYRMAIQVSGHKPFEIVTDNQGGHKKLASQKFFQRLCHIYRTTVPYNGSSKTIENIFYRFQHQVLHKDWRFTGQNITAIKADSRPNLEFVEANKARLYTLDELKAAYLKARTQWNEMAHPATGISRIEMYRQSLNPKTPAVTPAEMIDMFWVMSDKPCTFTASGLDITINKKKHTYEVFSAPGIPDQEWRRTHTYQKFYVQYDPYDLTSVRLYWMDKAGGYRFERVAEPYMVIHRAIQDQTPAEEAFIRAQQKASDENRVERQVIARTIEREEGVAPEQHGLVSPDIKGVGKEVRRQAKHRTRLYSTPPYELSLGRVQKKVSRMDWSEVSKTVQLNDKKIAEKL